MQIYHIGKMLTTLVALSKSLALQRIPEDTNVMCRLSERDLQRVVELTLKRVFDDIKYQLINHLCLSDKDQQDRYYQLQRYTMHEIMDDTRLFERNDEQEQEERLVPPVKPKMDTKYDMITQMITQSDDRLDYLAKLCEPIQVSIDSASGEVDLLYNRSQSSDNDTDPLDMDTLYDMRHYTDRIQMTPVEDEPNGSGEFVRNMAADLKILNFTILRKFTEACENVIDELTNDCEAVQEKLSKAYDMIDELTNDCEAVQEKLSKAYGILNTIHNDTN